ncbi:MAG TPA: GNAT family N-acetyltransferase [Alphaproteobacteria bacterium]|nr:GNAT family N-acetyltransferase [Alphaproteobacteria bacterium]
MTNIEILPIFRQNSLLWNEFANIEAYALNARYGLPLCKEDIKRTSYNYQQIWKLQKNSFAFGAYDNKDLIGFICGYYYKNLASVSNLYVMPNYQSNGIASALLKHAEKQQL